MSMFYNDLRFVCVGDCFLPRFAWYIANIKLSIYLVKVKLKVCIYKTVDLIFVKEVLYTNKFSGFVK